MAAATSGVKIIKKWELFRATDYISLMWPSFELLRVWGLFPYKINNSNLIVSSKPGFFYSTIVSSLHVVLLAIILYLMDMTGDLSYDSVPGTLQGNCYLISGLWIGMVSYLQSSRRLKFLQELNNVATKIPTNKFKKLSKFIHAKDLFGFIFVIAQSPNAYAKYLPLFACKVLCIHTTVIGYLMDTLYMNSVLVIRQAFKTINDKLLSLKYNIEHDEPHLLRRIYHEKKNPILLMEIRDIKCQHNDVSELIDNLNKTFSYQLIASVTITFAEITFSLYFYILLLLGLKGINLERQIWYSYFSTAVTYHAIKLTTIVWSCEMARDEATRTGVVVHELLIDTVDKQVKDEVNFIKDLFHLFFNRFFK